MQNVPPTVFRIPAPDERGTPVGPNNQKLATCNPCACDPKVYRLDPLALSKTSHMVVACPALLLGGSGGEI